ncbi:MAG: winged helix-turn-helix domain-containing protein [Candidatus Woesearchaeota archaeon]|jgi:DNA-binding transcriptional ArsR family regulator
MAENSFVLISLKDDKAKKLGELLGNPTAKRILELLAKKEYTATDIAKELSLPLSTIHYNLTNLEDGKLVKADEFHYSVKGKEIKHYTLTNKMVIITPEPASESIIAKLKKILPVAIVAASVTTAVQWYWNTSSVISETVTEQAMLTTMPMREVAVEKVVDYNMAIAQDSIAFQSASSVAESASSANLIWLFAIIIMAIILSYLGITLFMDYWNRK